MAKRLGLSNLSGSVIDAALSIYSSQLPYLKSLGVGIRSTRSYFTNTRIVDCFGLFCNIVVSCDADFGSP